MKSYVQSTRNFDADTAAVLRKRNSQYLPSTTSKDSQKTVKFDYIIYDTTDFLGIFAFYRKNPLYTGPLFALRRGSDNAEADFNSVDEAVAWLGGATGYMRTWYDQTLNQKHFTETATGNQPQFRAVDGFMKNQACMIIGGLGMSGTLNNANIGTVAFSMAFYTYTGGNRILAGTNNWLVGPYSGVYNLFAGGFSGGPGVNLNAATIQTAYMMNSGGFLNRVNGGATGGNAGATTPGTLVLGNRGAFGEPSGSALAEVLVKKDITTSNGLNDLEKYLNAKYQIY